jgi:hypothetical protein
MPKLNLKESRGFLFAHVTIAFFFFSNFFLFGQILIASTDMLIINFPMMLQAKRSFLSGEIPLWNPYLMGGVSNFLCGVGPFFSPENWVHFLVPERFFFPMATFLQFVRLSLVGIFAFLLFFEELGDKRWAFFASSCYQLCGYTLWTSTAYDTLSLVMYFTWALYLIWTACDRPLYRQYAYLTVISALMVLSSNIAYGPYALAGLPLFILYRYFTGHRRIWVGALSLLTAGLLIMVRFLPAWLELQDANRIAKSWEVDVQSLDVLGLRLIVPEIFAVAYERSREVLAGVLPHSPGVHIHWAMPHFFGVLPFCLLLWAIFSRQQKRTWFWLGYVLVSLSLILYLPPVDTLVRLLAFPAYHAFAVQIFLPIGVCLLAAYTGMRLESHPLSFLREQRARVFFYVTLGTLLLFAILVWVSRYRFTEPMWVLKGVGVGSAVILCVFFLGLERASLEKMRPFASALAWGTLLFALVIRVPNTTFLSHLKMLLVSLASLFWFGGHQNRRQTLIFLGIAMAVLIWPWAGAIHQLPEPRQDLMLAMLGIGKALLVVALFVLTLTSKRAAVYPLCLVLTLLDQIPAMKIHSHIAINPFSTESTPYPERPLLKTTMDLSNFRVNRPHLLLHLPVYDALWGRREILSSLYSVYGIRSFGGYFNAVSARYARFSRAFDADYGFGGISTESHDDRFLDLMGVRYDFLADKDQVEIRPNALSRVTWFSDYRMAGDDKALEIVKSKEFDPRRQVIVSEAPSFVSEVGEARSLSVREETQNRVSVEVTAEKSGLLLLDDTYHAGWTVYVDGNPQRVFQADYAFMATSVPAGHHQVTFRFEPKFFQWGLRLTFLGLGILLCLSGLFWLVDRVPLSHNVAVPMTS